MFVDDGGRRIDDRTLLRVGSVSAVLGGHTIDNRGRTPCSKSRLTASSVFILPRHHRQHGNNTTGTL
jgi:hypothetical protein